jgi:hypothetical protein
MPYENIVAPLLLVLVLLVPLLKWAKDWWMEIPFGKYRVTRDACRSGEAFEDYFKHVSEDQFLSVFQDASGLLADALVEAGLGDLFASIEEQYSIRVAERTEGLRAAVRGLEKLETPSRFEVKDIKELLADLSIHLSETQRGALAKRLDVLMARVVDKAHVDMLSGEISPVL